MTDQDATLLDAAAEAARSAYAPYSNYRVGAALVGADGNVVTGSNVENAAYGSTMCAEANVIGSAVSAGTTTIDVVAVACLDGDTCTPCGNCRQVMREFGVQRVIARGRDGRVAEFTLDELLPEWFGPEALNE